MTLILENVVDAKTKADRTKARIYKAEQQFEGEKIRLQTARQKYHKVVGPYPLKWRFKGPFREAFDRDDWLYYTFMFAVACGLTFLLNLLVGYAAMFVLGITAVYIASRMRFKWARFTNWANTGRG